MVCKFGKGHQALRRGRVSLPGQIYNITTATIERRPVFLDHRAARAASARFQDPALLSDAQLLAWVLMPDHVHWLLRLGEHQPLSTVVRGLKAASARAVNTRFAREGPLWSRGYHDHALRREDDVVTVARYIIANPLRAGLARRVGDYPYWNAVWLETT